MTNVPLLSKNLAMDLVNSASLCCLVFPLMNVSFRVYLSSNLWEGRHASEQDPRGTETPPAQGETLPDCRAGPINTGKGFYTLH